MTFALLVAHDEDGVLVGERVASLCVGSEATVTVVADPAAFTAAQVENDVGGIRPGEPYPVIHVLGREPSTANIDSVRSIDKALGAAHPALVRQHWLIIAAHESFDDAEKHVARRFLDLSTDRIDAHGVLIASAVTKQSIQHEDDVEIAFCGDVAFALVASDLRRSLDYGRACWAVAATSVVYRSEVLAEAIVALQSLPFFEDQLLATEERSGSQAAADQRRLGSFWVDECELQSKDTLTALRLLEGGADVDRLLRADELRLDRFDIGAWPDVLASYYDQMLVTRLPIARRQVAINAAALLARLASEARHLSRSKMVDRPNIERSELFWNGVEEALDNVERELLEERLAINAELPDVDRCREELVRAVRAMPYLAALVGQVALGVVLAFYLVQLTVPADMAERRQQWGWGAALVLIVIAALDGYRRRRRVVAARSRYVSAITTTLRSAIKTHVIDELIRVVRGLKAAITSAAPDPGASPLLPRAPSGASPDSGTDVPAPILDDLRALREAATKAQLELHNLATTRRRRTEHATAYAVTLPSADDVSTASLLARLTIDDDDVWPVLAAALFRERLSRSPDEIGAIVLSTMSPSVSPKLPQGLGSHLESNPDSASRAHDLLVRLDLAPKSLTQDLDAIHRRVCFVPGGIGPTWTTIVNATPSTAVEEEQHSGLVPARRTLSPARQSVADLRDDGVAMRLHLIKLEL